MRAYGNRAFLYLPYVYNDEVAVIRSKLANHGWTSIEDSVKYLLPYVLRNHAGNGQDGPLFCHQVLPPHFGGSILELAPKGKPSGKKYGRKKSATLVVVHKVHSYTFVTGIGIIGFEISLLPWTDTVETGSLPTCNSPLQLARWLNDLRQVGAGVDCQGSYQKHNRLRSHGGVGQVGSTLLEHAESLLKNAGITNAHFFPYVTRENAHANVLAHVRCMDESALHDEMPCAEIDTEENDKQAAITYLAGLWDPQSRPYTRAYGSPPVVITASPDTHWGISREALACITYPNHYGNSHGRMKFLSWFDDKGMRDYQLMYVLLLHQKYAYLTFLDQLDQGMWDDRKRLETFRKRLEEFHANYVFGKVSDTPEYEFLHRQIASVLDLQAMETDIREPVEQLGRLLQNDEKKKEKDRDDRLSSAMNILTFLAVVSVIADGGQVISFFGLSSESPCFLPVYRAYCTAVLIVFLIVLYKMHASKD